MTQPAQFFTREQIAALAREWNKVDRVDPTGSAYRRLIAFLDALPEEPLRQLNESKIKFVSSLAYVRIKRRNAPAWASECDQRAADYDAAGDPGEAKWWRDRATYWRTVAKAPAA